MSEEDLNEKDQELLSEPMIKKITFLMHKYADQRHEDYKEVQKKCKKKFAYSNLAKMPIMEGHAMITKLIELTGGEEEEKKAEQKEITKDDTTKKAEKKEETKDQEKGTPQDEDLVTSTMRKAARAAVDITLKEVVEKEVPVQGLGSFVLEICKVIFEAKMTEEASE